MGFFARALALGGDDDDRTSRRPGPGRAGRSSRRSRRREPTWRDVGLIPLRGLDDLHDEALRDGAGDALEAVRRPVAVGLRVVGEADFAGCVTSSMAQPGVFRPPSVTYSKRRSTFWPAKGAQVNRLLDPFAAFAAAALAGVARPVGLADGVVVRRLAAARGPARCRRRPSRLRHSRSRTTSRCRTRSRSERRAVDAAEVELARQCGVDAVAARRPPLAAAAVRLVGEERHRLARRRR